MDTHSSVQSDIESSGTPPSLLILILMAGASAMSMNIFLPSLPSMAEYFAADYAFMQLSISAYLGVTGVMQIFLGPLSDRFGRRAVLLWSFGVFLMATVGCLLSPTAEIFMVFRLLQAAIATGMVLSRAIVRDLYEGPRAAAMMGYLAMGMAVSPMLGPMIGGVFEELFGWQANFLFLLSFCSLVYVGMWFRLGESNKQQSTSITAQLAKYPGLFSSRRFWGYTLSSAFGSGCFFAFLGGGPYVGTEVLNVTPSVLGVYFGIISLGYMCGNFFTSQFSHRISLNNMILLGQIIAASGIALSLVLTYSGVLHPLAVFGSIVFVGFGNGLTLPNAQVGMLSVRPDLAGSASGLGGAVMIGGGAVISAITGALLGPGTGPFPLLWMMFGSALAGVLTALYVIRREAWILAQEAGSSKG